MQSHTKGPVGAPLGGGPSEQCSTASVFVGRLAGLLAMHIRSGHLSDPSAFSDICFSLAKSLPHLLSFTFKAQNHVMGLLYFSCLNKISELLRCWLMS
jgi:hypothetical protein